MQCEKPYEVVACAIRDSAEPDTFQVFAYLVVPLFLGLVTLAVAIASWTIARASLRQTAAIEHVRDRSERSALKLAIAERIYAWSGSRWTGDRPGSADLARWHAELGRISISLGESGLYGASVLQNFLWNLDRAEDEKLRPLGSQIEELALTRRAGSFAAFTERAVIGWVRAREDLDDFLKALEAEIPDILDRSRTMAEQDWMDVVRNAGRLRRESVADMSLPGD